MHPPLPATPAAVPAAARHDLAGLDFDRSPFLVIWETTRACDLACLHCRASAHPLRHPDELTTAEARALLRRIRAFDERRPPLLVLTGGDPLKRPDVTSLVAHGTELGLRVALTPSGTPLMTPPVLAGLRDAGLARLAVSLDGSTAAIHDRFRGVDGSWAWTIAMLREAARLGLPTQINTTVSRHNRHDVDAIAALVRELGITLWSVFLVVPTGRARPGDLLAADEVEALLHRLHDLSLDAPFDVKTTAAPHYRRVALQRRTAARRAGGDDAPAAPAIGFTLADHIGRARGVNDGNGFAFVSHTGDVYPSGFLPLSAGNVRTHDLLELYRTSGLFRALRDPDALRGKCGACEFRRVCGGSRARAYALTGDVLAADPSCAYIPPAWARRHASGATA
jgi:radical SAM protein